MECSSIALVGDESLSVCLRALTCIEIYLNAQFYTSHTALAGLTNETAFLKCFSADVPGTRSNRLSAVFAEAVASARNYRYSSFLCLLGLSSVIKLPIKTYYPIAEEGQSDDLISTESICNCTVYPTVIDDRSEHRIHIFRCAKAPIDFVSKGKVPENKDHYVPLLNNEEVVPVYASNITSKVHTNYHQPSSFQTSQPPVQQKLLELKRKQTSIVSLLKKVPRPSLEERDSRSVLQSPETAPASSKTSMQPSKTPEPVDVSEPSFVITEKCREQEISATYDDNNIGNFCATASSLTHCQRFDKMCNVWKPDDPYSFSANSSGRKFQSKWLKTFNWLTYSKTLDGAFCINCVLFGGESSHDSSKLEHLYESPFCNWNVVLKRLL